MSSASIGTIIKLYHQIFVWVIADFNKFVADCFSKNCKETVAIITSKLSSIKSKFKSFCFISKFNQNLSAKSFVFSSHSKFLSQDSTLSQLFAKSKLFLPQPDHKSKAFFQTGFSIIFTSILTS